MYISPKVEFAFLRQSIRVFNKDMAKATRVVQELDAKEQNEFLILIESTVENVQYVVDSVKKKEGTKQEN